MEGSGKCGHSYIKITLYQLISKETAEKLQNIVKKIKKICKRRKVKVNN